MIKNKIKRIKLILIILLIGIVMVGCKDEINNNSLDRLGINIKDNTVAVILNNPTTEQLSKVSNLSTFDYDKSNQTLLIIPIHNKMTVEIYEVAFEDNEFREGEVLYKDENIKDGYGLLLRAYRPEGVPSIKIKVYSNNLIGEYIVSYDGKDGTPDVEYITNKNK